MTKSKRIFAGAVSLSLGLALSACGGMPENRSLYSTKQPVVERTNYTFDVRSGAAGLSSVEEQRLAGWFETMELGYGDRVSIEDPMRSPAVAAAVSALAGRHGILVSQGAPVTQGFVQPGNARIVITRSTASVPGCPDWDIKSDINYNNGTHPGFGCGVNGNLAAMVANPEDLISGQRGTGETVIRTSNKAIQGYVEQPLTGAEGLAGSGLENGGD
ncbi:CpaD family pilus assembly protein [Qipengyuania sp. DSG2-2]|uniref:CpaD family pilus assembly protein n=1 Tax=Qipengyuania sp. DGS2-2 TaxID=3349631 RepID=UPI0036D3DAA4